MADEKRFLENEEATEQLGAELAKLTPPGGTWLLTGELGAGKTAWTRGFVAGLGGLPEQVASPTYAVLHRYDVKGSRVFHLDLYRLGEGGSWSLGLEETLLDTDYLVVEWAGVHGPWPTEWVARLTLDIQDDGRMATWSLPSQVNPCC